VQRVTTLRERYGKALHPPLAAKAQAQAPVASAVQ
jgi:hypothetical protein